MIVVKEKVDLKNIDDQIALYHKIFPDDIIEKFSIKDKKSIASLSIGLYMLTNKIYRLQKTKFSSLACIVLENTMIDNEKCKKGSIILIGHLYRKNHKDIVKSLQNCLILYDESYLPEIYRTIKDRLQYKKRVQKVIQTISNGEEVVCPQKCLKLDMLGSGCYGNVYKTNIENKPFAMKVTALDNKAIEKPYDPSVGCWHEVHFLYEILRPIIEKRICPNIPLLYHIYSCPECCITIDNEKKKGPCVSSLIELADGNLKNFLSKKPKLEELHSCLFQIFAGLYTIQKYTQIMNFDVKKENILFYNVEPGGYWKYNIFGQDYYVPNYGKLFVLNDFGISRSMSPQNVMYRSDREKTFRLGCRYAFVLNDRFYPFNSSCSYNEKGEKSEPIKISWEDGKTSSGCEFRMDRNTKKILPVTITYNNKQFAFDSSSKDFFLNPDYIPPFEFFNDTQDALRMFTGGKRTTQKGNHRLMEINKTFIKSLKPYISNIESSKNNIFSLEPSRVMAGYFIKSFFHFYQNKQKDIIEEYII